jgi:hypothetical protein
MKKERNYLAEYRITCKTMITMITTMYAVGIRPPGRPSNGVSVRRPTRKSTRRPRTTVTTNQLIIPAHTHTTSQKRVDKKKMIVTTLRRGLLRTHAPHRRLPFSTSTSLSSSSSSSTSASASAAQKKAQDALGNVSAALTRAGAYARSALGPFGARLSGLLGCSSRPHSLPPVAPPYACPAAPPSLQY